MSSILIIEDERPIRDMVGFALRKNGFSLYEAGSGQEAEKLLHSVQLDVVLLDWMLPDISGIEILRRIKRDDATSQLPVIMLTARTEEEDKIFGLDTGADDYVTKPFSTKELLARIRALLRRTATEEKIESLTLGPINIDTASHRVLINNKPIECGPTEYRLLKFFIKHADRVYSRAQLLDQVWGRNVYIEERTVDVHVLRLRKLLTPYACDQMLQTVRGAGYRFSKPM